ncbi:MAG: MAPEG family protein [Deltaproteobacteria bacterium]|nr:MAPEG family protein [Deltaproteobacteria bacterium]
MQSNLYLAIHAFLTIIFGIRIVRLRWKHKVSLGHGDKQELIAATRVFGNHNEYAPLFLILLFVLDFQNASAAFINTLGIAFTIGRISHAYALTHFVGRSRYRVIGMVLTFGCLAAQAIALLLNFRP